MSLPKEVTITIPADKHSETLQNAESLLSQSVFRCSVRSQLKHVDVRYTSQYGVTVMLDSFSLNVDFECFDKNNHLSYYLTKEKNGAFVLYVNNNPYAILLDYDHIKYIPKPDFAYKVCVINNFININGLENYCGLVQLRLTCPELTDIAPLGSLADLTFLNMSCNKISNIGPIVNLKVLDSIYLSKCNEISDYTPLCELKTLKTLFIAPDESSALEVEFIKKLFNLERLVLRNFKSLETLPDCSKLKKLTNVSISGTPLLNNIHTLVGLKSITELSIDYNIKITCNIKIDM